MCLNSSFIEMQLSNLSKFSEKQGSFLCEVFAENMFQASVDWYHVKSFQDKIYFHRLELPYKTYSLKRAS